MDSSTNSTILTQFLFKTLVQELIARDCRKFWTPAYKELSNKLPLPVKTSVVDSNLTAVEKETLKKSSCLITSKTNLTHNMSYELSTSSVSDEWSEDLSKNYPKFKSLKIQVELTPEQKVLFNEYYGVFRYVHNKTLERIKYGGEFWNPKTLRDLLVTTETKKNSNTYKYYTIEKNRLKQKLDDETDEAKKTELNLLLAELNSALTEALKDVKAVRNPYVLDWETNFPKDVRENAVNKVCNSYQTATANLKSGNIRSFDISFMKKSNNYKTFELSSRQLYVKNADICLPCFKGCPILKVTNNSRKELIKNNIVVNHNCDFIYSKGKYWIVIPISIKFERIPNKEQKFSKQKYTAIDLGLVKLATTFNNRVSTEYKHDRELLKRYNDKIRMFKSKRTKQERLAQYHNKLAQLDRNCSNYRKLKKKLKRSRCIKKRVFNKLEKKKKDYVDHLHWILIREIFKENDVIFLGDINSHSIVKGNKNKLLNQEMNDMKFYVLKSRFLYKSRMEGKKIVLVNESYTSQGCSVCGQLKKIKYLRIYNCQNCNTISDRDINAAKNILMKGIMSLNFA